jgi:UDP-perosamine 4-acetyltransferase
MATAQQHDLVIFGAGGHAKVVIETCIGTPFRPVACLGASRWTSLVGVPVESEDAAEQWRDRGARFAFVAIGNNEVRERVAARVTGLGFELATIVSPHAWVSPSVKLGPGTVVMAGAIIQVEASIGACGIVNTGASIDHECMLGRAVHAAPHSTLCGNVVAGNRVWIGAGSTIIEGRKLADDVFVAAGATVVYDMPVPSTRCGGVPARVLRQRSA